MDCYGFPFLLCLVSLAWGHFLNKYLGSRLAIGRLQIPSLYSITVVLSSRTPSSYLKEEDKREGRRREQEEGEEEEKGLWTRALCISPDSPHPHPQCYDLTFHIWKNPTRLLVTTCFCKLCCCYTPTSRKAASFCGTPDSYHNRIG